MKSINLRFCLVLVVVLVVSAGAVYGLHAFQVGRHGEFFLEQAKLAVEKKDVPGAISNYQHYLNLEPGDADAVAQLGIVLADAGAADRAYKTLEKAVRLDGGQEEARRRLVEVTLALGRHRDARVHLDQLMKAAPDDAELLGYLGRCQAADQQFGEAAETLKKAIESDPQETDHYLYLVSILEQRPDDFREEPWKTENATYWMDKLVAANGESSTAYFARARHRLSNGDFEQALADAEKTLQLEPAATRAMLLAAECLLRLERGEEARELAERAVEEGPGDPQAYTTLAGVELAEGNTQEAVGWLEKGDAAVEVKSAIPVQLAELLIRLDRIDDAERVADSLAAREYPGPIVGLIKGKIAFKRGQWLEARRQLTSLRADVVSNRDLADEVEFWLAKTNEQLGDTEAAIRAYRQSIQVDSTNVTARAALADLLGRTGRYAEAAEELQTLSGFQGSNVGLQLQLARQLFLQNLSLPPNERDWARVTGILGVLKTAAKGVVAVPLLEADVLIAQNRLDEAEKLLVAAKDESPGEAALWSALVQLANRRDDHEKASQLLKEAREAAGDSPILRLAEASQLVGGSEVPADVVEELVRLGSNAEEFPAEQRRILWTGLAQAALRADRPQAASEILEAALAEVPSDLGLNELAFRAAAEQKDAGRVASCLERIQQTEGTGPLWHYAQALWMLQKSDELKSDELAEAQKHLAEAGKVRADWANVPLLEATIHERQGDKEAATQDYLKAIDLGVSDMRVVRRTVELLYEQQQFAKASGLLQKLEEGGQVADEDYDRMKSMILGRQDKFEEALEPARRVAAKSEESRDHLWLGQVASRVGFRRRDAGQQAEADGYLAEAETALGRARELGPSEPAPWIAMIELCLRSGRREDADALLAELKESGVAKESPRVLADAYLMFGEGEKAAEALQAALEANPKDPTAIRNLADFCIRTGRAQLAEEGLRGVALGEISASPEDVAWCRRTYALALRSGGFHELQQALKLIDANLAKDPNSILDRRTKAVLLSGHPERAKRQQAAEILKGLVEEPNSNSEETRLLLARLYAADGQWNRAVPLLRVMSSPEALRLYANHLIESGALDEAELRVRRLEQLSPDDLPTLALRMELQFRRKRFTDMLAAVDNRVKDAANPQQVLQLASMLGDLAQRLDAAEAAPLQEKAAELVASASEEGSDEPSLDVVVVLARAGKAGEALDRFDRAISGSEPGQIGLVASALATALKDDGQAESRLESMVEKAIAEHGRSVPLLQALVWVKDAQQKYTDVESLYREILEKDANNVVALNNLAELLALSGRNVAEAFEMVNRAIKIAGPLAPFLDTRATVHRAMNQPAKAILDMQKVVLERQQPNALARLAMAYAEVNDLGRAAQALSQADKLGFDQKDLHPLEKDKFNTLTQRIPSSVP